MSYLKRFIRYAFNYGFSRIILQMNMRGLKRHYGIRILHTEIIIFSVMVEGKSQITGNHFSDLHGIIIKNKIRGHYTYFQKTDGSQS